MSSYIWIPILIAFIAVLNYITRRLTISDTRKKTYTYTKKHKVMTEHEHSFYKILNEALGREYYILAQAHLSTFLAENVKGQNWKAAFRHVNGKSVDFLLCDKQTLEPLLAIELDDKTHEQTGRILRDTEVERILASARVPLIRMQTHGEIHIPDFQKLVQTTILKQASHPQN
jgi:hypothetical protein